MPKAAEVYPPKREGWDFIHGDPRGAMAPFRQVWNTYNKATGSATTVPKRDAQDDTISNIVVVPERGGRRFLSIVMDMPTGTGNVWLGLGHLAGVHRGIGPLTAHGSSAVMDGTRGIYPGTIYAISDEGPITLCWEEGWTDEPPVNVAY